MNIDDIITLDNDARYYIIDNIDFNDVTYYLAVGLFDNDEVENIDDMDFLAVMNAINVHYANIA